MSALYTAVYTARKARDAAETPEQFAAANRAVEAAFRAVLAAKACR
jgi:hypothetical protein